MWRIIWLDPEDGCCEKCGGKLFIAGLEEKVVVTLQCGQCLARYETHFDEVADYLESYLEYRANMAVELAKEEGEDDD